MHLHHIALGATNVAQLSAFYSKSFSLKERSRQSDDAGLRAVWLEMDPGILMIERVDDENVWEESERRGLFLLAFRVIDFRRKVIEERVESEGGTIESRTEFTTYFRDPENNRVAISCHSLHI